MEFFEDMLEANPNALTVEGELDEDVLLHPDDPEMQEIEKRLRAGEDIETILDSWEDEETKEFWRKRGEKKTVAAKPPPPPTRVPSGGEDEEDIEDDYTKDPAPLKL